MKIMIIGGGASGMMAAGIATTRGARVILLEKNEKLGKKLYITGKGRCNLTNNCDISEVIDNIPTGGRFLHSALNTFSPSAVIELFESMGVALKTERGNRVFPASDKSSDVVSALMNFMTRNNVEIKNERAESIIVADNKVCGVKTTIGKHMCEAVILSTGGMSYPATGSTGDGYDMARKLGHTITPLRASLVPLVAKQDFCSKMQGLSLKNVRLSVYEDNADTQRKAKPIFEDFGEILFTHYGLSGPLTLSASAHMREFEKKKYYVLLDFKPALNESALDKRVQRDFQKYSNRDFANALGDLLPKLSIPVIIEKSEIPPDTKVHSVTREERLRLVKLLKAFRIDIKETRPIEEAVITSGGVDLKEINPKTMESKLIRGLYFAGEIIDADAYTGGFNLQIAWSTAYCAAVNCVKNVCTPTHVYDLA